jgi:hypothetical protein
MLHDVNFSVVRPVLIAIFVASRSVAATRWSVTSFLISSQSVTMTPSKPISSRSTPVSSSELACTGTPLTSPEFTITEAAPASTAAWNGAR